MLAVTHRETAHSSPDGDTLAVRTIWSEAMNAKKHDKPQHGNGSDKPQVLDDLSKHNIRRLGKDEKPTVRAVMQGSDWSDARVEYHYEVGGTAGVKSPHQAVSVLDFSECSREDLLKLACRPVIIALQRRWNTIAKDDLAKATAPGTFAYVNVKTDIVDVSRQSAPPLSKVNKAMSKMSADEKRKLLEQLEAELNGSTE